MIPSLSIARRLADVPGCRIVRRTLTLRVHRASPEVPFASTRAASAPPPPWREARGRIPGMSVRRRLQPPRRSATRPSRVFARRWPRRRSRQPLPRTRLPRRWDRSVSDRHRHRLRLSVRLRRRRALPVEKTRAPSLDGFRSRFALGGGSRTHPTPRGAETSAYGRGVRERWSVRVGTFASRVGIRSGADVGFRWFAAARAASRGVFRQDVGVLGKVEVRHRVEPALSDSLRIVRDSGFLLGVVQTDIPVFASDELSDARLPALLVPRHAQRNLLEPLANPLLCRRRDKTSSSFSTRSSAASSWR